MVTKLHTDTILTGQIMDCQMHAIGKAIRQIRLQLLCVKLCSRKAYLPFPQEFIKKF